MTDRVLDLLVAEDDAATLQLVGDVAQYCGWRVHSAADGREALALLRDRSFDLVISDVMMPGVDGFELLTHVRKHHPALPFVLMTASRGEESPIRALRMGATDFLVKPLPSIKDLRVLLNRYHGRSGFIQARARILSSVVSTDLSLENDLGLIPEAVDYLTAQLPGTVEAYAVRLGLTELIANAMEHGNLGITGTEKRAALEDTDRTWQRILSERRSHPELAARRVRVHFERTATEFAWTIADEGAGFDCTNLPDPTSPANLEAPCGRGIFICQQEFDVLEFLGSGNTVRAVKRHGGAA